MVIVQVNLKTLERKVISEYAHPKDIDDDALARLIAKCTMEYDKKTQVLQSVERG